MTLETHANRKALRKLATAGAPLGLIGYLDGEPVAWCAVAPPEAFPRLEKSRARTAARVKSQGDRIIEGYPVEPRKEMPAAFAWTGTSAAFAQAGFVEVARPLSLPIVRRKT